MNESTPAAHGSRATNCASWLPPEALDAWQKLAYTRAALCLQSGPLRISSVFTATILLYFLTTDNCDLLCTNLGSNNHSRRGSPN